MSQPSQLTPADQDALVKQIGIALMRAAPQEWQQIRTEYRAAGRYYELTTEVVDEAGVASAWTASHDIAMLFANLRAGMHSVRGGTWFNARYQIDRPSRYNLEFDREEPNWRTPPPLQAYRDELHFFPRNDDDVPEWLVRRLSGLRPEQPGKRFRIARIFDGRGPSGRPSVNRPPVPEEEKDRLLTYLDRSPMILPERGHDIDRLSADGGQNVPVAFHSDGVWIWPAAVNYYLRHYGLPPEPGLVDAARANDFQPPEIDEATANEAAANITGGRPPGPPQPPGPPPPGQGMPGQGMPEPGAMEPGPVAQAPPPPAPPAAPAPRHRPDAPPEAPEESREAIAALRGKLRELGVPDTAYRIGTPEPNAWFLEQSQDGWQVGWYERDFSTPMVFDDVADAAAFLLGKLLLEGREPSGRHSDATAARDAALDAPLERQPEPELDARPVPAAASDVDEPQEPTIHSGRNGSGRHDDAGIRAAAASANVDLGAHGFSNVGQDRFDEDRFDQGQFDEDRFSEDGFDQDRFDQHRFEQDEYEQDDTQFAPVGYDPARHDTSSFDPSRFDSTRFDQDGFDRDDTQREDIPRGDDEPQDGNRSNGTHEPRDPARFAATGLGGGPSDPSARAAALNTSTMVGTSPVEAPTQPGGRDAARPEPRPQEAPAARGGGSAEQSAPAQWEIQPLPGEPPLTLFRGKQLVRLDPGTEIDRFGDEHGNLTYAAGTPFEERSLVPEWVNRPYHVYQATGSIEVLTGIAIPWFEQPGGGTAYLLPRSVDELLASGELVEVDVDGRP